MLMQPLAWVSDYTAVGNFGTLKDVGFKFN